MSGQITINGEERALGEARTLDILLTSLGVDSRKVAVELNLEIVPRSAYGVTAVAPRDRLEIVHFIVWSSRGRGVTGGATRRGRKRGHDVSGLATFLTGLLGSLLLFLGLLLLLLFPCLSLLLRFTGALVLTI